MENNRTSVHYDIPQEILMFYVVGTVSSGGLLIKRTLECSSHVSQAIHLNAYLPLFYLCGILRDEPAPLPPSEIALQMHLHPTRLLWRPWGRARANVQRPPVRRRATLPQPRLREAEDTPECSVLQGHILRRVPKV